MLSEIISKLERVPILIVVTVFFVLGIFISSITSIPFFTLAIFVFSLLVLALFFRNKNIKFLFILFFCALVLGILHTKNYLRLPGNHISRLNSENISLLRIEGVVDSDPIVTSRKTSFIFKASSVSLRDGQGLAKQSIDVQGIVLVNIFKKEKFAYGDKLMFSGKLFKPFDYSTEDNFSYRDYLHNQGIFSILNVSKDDEVVFFSKKENFLKALAFKIKHKFRDIFKRYLTPLNSCILNGIILGDRQGLPSELRDAFVATGTAHIIAISGFNVGIITFILLIFLKVLGLKRKARYLVIIPLLIIHMLAVGLSASVVRATVMAIILLFAYLIDSEAHLINSLSLAALVILGFNPLQIYDVGFQLSFISILGIMWLSPKISAVFIKEKDNYFKKVVVNSFSVSFSAWLTTSGIIAYYFKVFAPVTVLANLIVVPLASLVIALGFTLALCGAFLLILAAPIAASTDFVLFLFVKIVFWFSHFPFACFYF